MATHKKTAIASQGVDRLRCPACVRNGDGRLRAIGDNWLVCAEPGCGRKYPVRNGLPVLLTDEGDKWADIEVDDLPPDTLSAMPNRPDAAWLSRKANELRITIFQMVIRAGSGHIGGAYSVIDVMTALYFRVLRIDPSEPIFPDRDRLIFSKGHSCLALYTALAEAGYFEPSRLREFNVDGGLLGGHPERGRIPGVEASTGSLGHGLPLATGMALAGKLDAADYRVYAVLSDGECNEGSVWEALMSAAQHKLDNLTVIIDSNNMLSLGQTTHILNIEPLPQRLEAFGWGVREIDGHDMEQILDAMDALPLQDGKPSAIVARTVKGKGVSFMENDPKWHLHGPTKEEARAAFSELAKGLRS